MKSIDKEVQEKTLKLLDEGLSAEKIARQLKISSRTVRRIRKTKRPAIQKSKGGRPAKLCETTKGHIKRKIMSGQPDNAVQVANQLRNESIVDISAKSVRRTLKELGMKAVIKQKKPPLLPRHRRERMEFAQRYKEWTIDDWKEVIWSDETKINPLGCDGRKWVWKRSGSALTDQQVQGRVKFGGGNLKMWGCMTAHGVGYCCKIDGGLDKELYTTILEEDLLGTLEYYGLQRGEIIFQQDNDSKHRSDVACHWLANNGIDLLQWPSCSPDLNPIEYLGFISRAS